MRTKYNKSFLLLGTNLMKLNVSEKKRPVHQKYSIGFNYYMISILCQNVYSMNVIIVITISHTL